MNLIDFMQFRKVQEILGSKSDKRLFGFELELLSMSEDCTKAMELKPAFVQHKLLSIAKYDGSVGKNGVEFVSNPFTYLWMKNNLSEFNDYIALVNEAELINTSRTGLHIHFGKELLNDNSKTNFVKFFINENNFSFLKKFSMRSGARQQSSYATWVRSADYCHGHSSAINFSTGNKPTIEARFYEATTNFVNFIGAFCFLKECIRFCRNDSDHSIKAFVDYLESKCNDEFAYNYIYKRALNAGFTEAQILAYRKDKDLAIAA